MNAYRLFVPKQAVGANLVYFDFFNAAGSGHLVEVLGVLPIVSGAVAVVGTLAVDLFLTRTTAVGTGGTAATYGGTSLTAMTISPLSGSGGIPSEITARLTPTGGATAGGVICWRSVFSEETNAGTYTPALDMVNEREGVLTLTPKSGIRVVQGAVASVGNIGFDVTFRIRPL